METISRGGRPVPGFALGEPPSAAPPSTVVYAALMTGAAIGLLVGPVLKAPLWGAIAAGVGATLLTKFGIDRASTA